MPSVTITLIDTPTGGVAIQTEFHPRAGNPCSPAQAAALDIIARTRRDYGLPEPDRIMSEQASQAAIAKLKAQPPLVKVSK